MARPWLVLAMVALAGLSALASADECDTVLRHCNDNCASKGLSAVTNVCKAQAGGIVKLCMCGQAQQKVASVAADELPAALPEADSSSELTDSDVVLSSTSTSSVGASSSSAWTSSTSSSTSSSALVRAAEEFASSLGLHAPAPVITSPSMSDAAMAEAMGEAMGSSGMGMAVESSSGKLPCHHGEGDSSASSANSVGSSTENLMNALMGRRFGPFPMPMPMPGSVSVVRMFPVNFVDPFFGIRQAFLAERMQMPSAVVIRITSSDGTGASSSEAEGAAEAMASQSFASGLDEMALPLGLPQQQQPRPSDEARAVVGLMNDLMSRVFAARSSMEAQAHAAQVAQQAQQRMQAEEAQRRAEQERQQAASAKFAYALEIIAGAAAGLVIVLIPAAACMCCFAPMLWRRQQEQAEGAAADDLDQPLISDSGSCSGSDSDGEQPLPQPQGHPTQQMAQNPAYFAAGRRDADEVATVDVIRFD